MINESGPLAMVYDQGLWGDEDALLALMSECNQNANIDMKEGEMTMFGRVHNLMVILGDTCIKNRKVDHHMVMERFKATGGSAFTDPQVRHVIVFRSQITANVADAFRQCQFHLVGDRVRVDTADYFAVAVIPGVWTKVSVILRQYSVGLAAQDAGSTGPRNTSFQGRVETSVKLLKKAELDELGAESITILDVDRYYKEVFKAYKVPEASDDLPEVLRARVRFLIEVGKMLLKLGATLHQASTKSSPAGPTERAKLVTEAMQGQYVACEEVMRQLLVEANVFPTTLPDQLYKPTTPKAGASNATNAVAHAADDAAMYTVPSGDGLGELREHDVYQRLHIKGCGEKVCMRVDPETNRQPADGIATEQPTDDSSANVPFFTRGKAIPKDVVTLIWVTLDSLELPMATVSVRGVLDSNVVDSVHHVSVDSLLPCAAKKEAETPKLELVLLPPAERLRDAGGFQAERVGSTLDRLVAETYLAWLHLQSSQTLMNVAVGIFSEEGKLPYVLQARSLKVFKKHELIMYPHGGAFTEDSFRLTADAKIMHDGLVFCAEMSTRVSQKGKKVAPAPSSRMQVVSPLFDGAKKRIKSDCLQGIAPYWAVGRRERGSKTPSNMERFTQSFEIPTPTSAHGRDQVKVGYKLEVQAMRNKTVMAVGEILVLDFRDEVEGL